MAPNKSPGVDKIPLRVVKYCLPAILPSITSIVNTTFLSAQFPNAWKIAKVTPILKESDWEIPNNYRPISLLPCFQRFARELPTQSAYILFNSKQTNGEEREVR